MLGNGQPRAHSGSGGGGLRGGTIILPISIGFPASVTLTLSNGLGSGRYYTTVSKYIKD